MQIFISPVSGSSICITVGNNCLYKDLKEIISEKFSIPTKYFKLVYNGKFIEHSFTDSNTRKYNIENKGKLLFIE